MTAPVDTLSVDLGDRSYGIRIGSGILSEAGEQCASHSGSGHRVLVITDEHVAPLYVEQTVQTLRDSGCAPTSLVVPAGERSKSVDCLTQAWEAAVEARLDRGGLVVALGGGVVGDLAGFVAASYLRGVSFMQMPTSLLAMVDSSVGGKTGLNLPQGKNLVGAFHQPCAVLADLDVLETLPARERSAGMAEVVKYGMIQDPGLLDLIESDVEAVRRLDADIMRALVKRSCEIKSDVVRQDEREAGLRAILNFGHTLGHAIEQVKGYGAWLHGEAIAAGMVYAARVSERMERMDAEVTSRLIRILEGLDLPVSWEGMEWEPLFNAMTADKKAQNAVPRFVLVRDAGQAGLPVEVPVDVLQSVFEDA